MFFLAFANATVGSHETSLELSKKYGEAMTIFFFNKPIVVLTDYKLAKNVLQETATVNDRPESPIIDFTFQGSTEMFFMRFDTLWHLYRYVHVAIIF
jgi:hypothetical protein